jgi:hypothetical protein
MSGNQCAQKFTIETDGVSWFLSIIFHSKSFLKKNFWGPIVGMTN